jgi:hypothetical protein
MPVVPTICLPHLDVDAEGLQPLGGRPAGGGPAGGILAGRIPAGGTLAEEGPAEEGPVGKGPADLLERSPSRGPVAWSPRRLWNLIGGCRGAGVGVGRGGFLSSGGRAGRDGQSQPSPQEPRSPLLPSPRSLALMGTPVARKTGPTTSATRAYLDAVPVVLSAAVAHSSAVARSSAVAYLLSHTRGRSAQPRKERIPAGGATLASGRPGRSNRRRRRPAGRGRHGPASRHRASGAGLDVRGGWLFPDWMTVSGLG